MIDTLFTLVIQVSKHNLWSTTKKMIFLANCMCCTISAMLIKGSLWVDRNFWIFENFGCFLAQKTRFFGYFEVI